MKKQAFSLVELMITLIIISCIISALTPMITKKLKSQGITVGSGSGNASINVDVKTECDSYSNCALCTSEKCVLCRDGICASNEYVNHDDCSCKPCTEFNSNCVECQIGGCLRCSSGFEFSNGSCNECPVGYYCDGEIKQACQSGYYQDETGKTSCKTCKSKDEKCVSCDSVTGECLECSEGYEIEDGGCVLLGCGDLAMELILNGKKVCMTKYNPGDDALVHTGLEEAAKLALPSTITQVYALSSCSPSTTNFCCWIGHTAHSSLCDSANGGYSGCNRTVCDWRAANEYCASITYLDQTWRLPTSNEWASVGLQLDNITKGLGTEGLMLCDAHNEYSSARCWDGLSSCYGAGATECYPRFVWSSDGSGDYRNTYHLTGGVFNGPNNGRIDFAYSVRCVAEL